jgi:hypothetical protein
MMKKQQHNIEIDAGREDPKKRTSKTWAGTGETRREEPTSLTIMSP